MIQGTMDGRSRPSLIELAESRKKQALGDLSAGRFPVEKFLSPSLSDLIRHYHPEFRKRIYTLETVIEMMVTAVLSGDNTLQSAVTKNNAKRVADGLPPASLNTAAFAEARQKLSADVLIQMVKNSSAAATSQFAEKTNNDFWCGLLPYALDGSTITANDTKENQAEFPQHGMQKEGVGFPIIRILILQSFITGMVCHSAMAPFKGKETGEMALSREVLPDLPQNSLLLGHRYFPSFFTMADLIKKDCHGLFQAHAARDYDFRRGKQLGQRDHVVEWEKPPRPTWMSEEDYARYDNKITLRETDVSKEIGQKNRKFILITTLLDDEKFDKKKLSLFYQKRWTIELAYRDLKSTFGMEHIAANSPEMIKKLFWNFLLSYNTMRWHMLNIAILFEKKLEHISVKTTARVMTENSVLLMTTEPTKLKELFIDLYDQIVRVSVGLRPERSEPRAVKKRPKPFPRLQERRNAWHSRQTP